MLSGETECEVEPMLKPPCSVRFSLYKLEMSGLWEEAGQRVGGGDFCQSSGSCTFDLYSVTGLWL